MDDIRKRDWFQQIADLPKINNPGRRDGYYNAYKVFCTNEVYASMKEDDILYYVDCSQYFREGFTERFDMLCDIVNEKNLLLAVWETTYSIIVIVYVII